VFSGVIEVKYREITIGYISATIVYDLQLIGSKYFPDFMESGTGVLSPVVDINELRIFEFKDSKVSRFYGDIYPSRDHVEPLWDAEFSQDNDAWINLTLNEEEYLTYLKRTATDGEEKITAILLKEKQLTWNLFNFFKLFVIHSLFILILLLVIFFLKFKKFNYTFRGHLLIAFLIISIIPVVVLAIYNREVVKERTRTAVINELNERLNYLENYILGQKEKHPARDLKTIFANAGRELGISFGAYENTEQIFNSKEQFYVSGFFTAKLNPQAYYNLNYLSYKEYLTRESIEHYYYDSFYKKIEVDDKSFIIGVNDAFNKVDIIYSTMDLDVFLFGIYSLAVLIIIIVSTILANNISAPIRKLTKATVSVARGDLNLELTNKEKGEIKELVKGFNSMTKELRKNQVELAELERENAWKEMAKQVAHEIKNPLTPLKLAVQQLVASYRDKSDKFDSVFEKVTQTILGQIENLSSIATEFSRFAKMPSLKLEEVNLQEVIKDTLNLFVDEKVKLIFNSDSNSSLIEADSNQLRRMIINLVRNSIQADANEIKIDLHSKENNFILYFADNGKGIPETDKDKIFEAGFTLKERGMGIGLKLSRRFLEGINGNIILQDSSGNGTTFKITIPGIKY
ncbi:MAG: ATP-binding protein, partial [Ignavibacteria bacterium]|nr:ATP-binding protein [Ignavibacteria bacterium]